MIIISFLQLSSNVNASVLNQKIICYRKYTSFNESAFLNDVAKLEFALGSKDIHEGYDAIKNNFLKVANKHAPLKKKTIRANDPPLRTKNFEKLFTF